MICGLIPSKNREFQMQPEISHCRAEVRGVGAFWLGASRYPRWGRLPRAHFWDTAKQQ